MTKAKVKVPALQPVAGKPAPLTEEEKKNQILRFLSQKRESYATGVLFNAVNSGLVDKSPEDLAKWAVEVADAMMKELFPVTAEEPNSDEAEK